MNKPIFAPGVTLLSQEEVAALKQQQRVAEAQAHIQFYCQLASQVVPVVTARLIEPPKDEPWRESPFDAAAIAAQVADASDRIIHAVMANADKLVQEQRQKAND